MLQLHYQKWMYFVYENGLNRYYKWEVILFKTFLYELKAFAFLINPEILFEIEQELKVLVNLEEVPVYSWNVPNV